MRKNCFSKKKIQHPSPPPPPDFFFYTNFFLMLEIAWNAKKTWNIEKQKINLMFDTRTDRRTDGGRCNISRPGPSAPREIIR